MARLSWSPLTRVPMLVVLVVHAASAYVRAAGYDDAQAARSGREIRAELNGLPATRDGTLVVGSGYDPATGVYVHDYGEDGIRALGDALVITDPADSPAAQQRSLEARTAPNFGLQQHQLLEQHQQHYQHHQQLQRQSSTGLLYYKDSSYPDIRNSARQPAVAPWPPGPDSRELVYSYEDRFTASEPATAAGSSGNKNGGRDAALTADTRYKMPFAISGYATANGRTRDLAQHSGVDSSDINRYATTSFDDRPTSNRGSGYAYRAVTDSINDRYVPAEQRHFDDLNGVSSERPPNHNINERDDTANEIAAIGGAVTVRRKLTAGAEAAGVTGNAERHHESHGPQQFFHRGSASLPTGAGQADGALSCLAEGLFRHPGNCSKFYRCVNSGDLYLEPVVFECAAGLAFDDRSTACTWPHSVPECFTKLHDPAAAVPTLTGRMPAPATAASEDEPDSPLIEKNRQISNPVNQRLHASGSFVDNTSRFRSQDSTFGSNALRPGVASFSAAAAAAAAARRAANPASQNAATTTTCRRSGLVAAPRCAERFYRCEAVANGEFLLYTYRCMEGTAYDPTVPGCVHIDYLPECLAKLRRQVAAAQPDGEQTNVAAAVTTGATNTVVGSSTAQSLPTTIGLAGDGRTTRRPIAGAEQSLLPPQVPRGPLRPRPASHLDGTLQDVNRAFDESRQAVDAKKVLTDCRSEVGGDSCTPFYRCADGGRQGRAFRLECPKSLVFDARTAECAYPEHVRGCERFVVGNQFISRPSLASGSSDDGNAQLPLPPPPPFPLPSRGADSGLPGVVTGFRCDREGFFKDATNCSTFIRCFAVAHSTAVGDSGNSVDRAGLTALQAARFECPQGLAFDQSAGTCNHAALVAGCQGVEGHGGESDGDSQSNNSKVAAFHRGVATLRCESDPVYDDLCTPFYRCRETSEDGRRVLRFSCPKDLVYDVRLQQCNYANSVAECRNPPPTRLNATPAGGFCTGDGFIRSATNCSQFFRCVRLNNDTEDFSTHLFSCPRGLVFDYSIDACNYPDAVNGDCGTALAAAEINRPNLSTQPDSLPTPGSHAVQSSARTHANPAQSDVYGKVPTDRDYHRLTFSPPPPPVQTLNRFAQPALSTQIQANAGADRKTTDSSPLVDAAMNASGEPLAMSVDYVCQAEGFFGQNGGCTGAFVRCVVTDDTVRRLIPHEFHCREGLVFDEASSSCNYPAMVPECGGSAPIGDAGHRDSSSSGKAPPVVHHRTEADVALNAPLPLRSATTSRPQPVRATFSWRPGTIVQPAGKEKVSQRPKTVGRPLTQLAVIPAATIDSFRSSPAGDRTRWVGGLFASDNDVHRRSTQPHSAPELSPSRSVTASSMKRRFSFLDTRFPLTTRPGQTHGEPIPNVLGHSAQLALGRTESSGSGVGEIRSHRGSQAATEQGLVNAPFDDWRRPHKESGWSSFRVQPAQPDALPGRPQDFRHDGANAAVIWRTKPIEARADPLSAPADGSLSNFGHDQLPTLSDAADAGLIPPGSAQSQATAATAAAAVATHPAATSSAVVGGSRISPTAATTAADAAPFEHQEFVVAENDVLLDAHTLTDDSTVVPQSAAGVHPHRLAVAPLPQQIDPFQPNSAEVALTFRCGPEVFQSRRASTTRRCTPFFRCTRTFVVRGGGSGGQGVSSGRAAQREVTDVYRYACPDHMVFSRELNTCDYASNVSGCEAHDRAPSVSAASDGGGDGGGSSSWATVGSLSSARCRTEGTFRAAGRCDSFFRCMRVARQRFFAYEFSCPSGLAFDPDTDGCSHPDRLREPCQETADGAAEAASAHHESADDNDELACNPNATTEYQRGESLVRSPVDCTRFYRCVSPSPDEPSASGGHALSSAPAGAAGGHRHRHRPLTLSCPRELVFSPATGTCVWPKPGDECFRPDRHIGRQRRRRRRFNAAH